MTREAFAAAVAARAGSLASGSWAFRTSEHRIEVPVQGRRHVFELELAYRRHSAARSGAERLAAVQAAAERLVAIVSEAADLDRALADWGWARDRLHLTLVSWVHEPPGAMPLARREWLPGLSTAYLVVDGRRGRLVTVTEDMRACWGVAESELHAVARERLERGRAPLRRMSSRAEVFGFCAPDDEVFLNAAQVLLPEQMQRAAEACRSEDLLVGLPELQAGLVWPAAGDPAPWMRRVVAALHADSTLPLCADPLRWTSGRWGRPPALNVGRAAGEIDAGRVDPGE